MDDVADHLVIDLVLLLRQVDDRGGGVLQTAAAAHLLRRHIRPHDIVSVIGHDQRDVVLAQLEGHRAEDALDDLTAGHVTHLLALRRVVHLFGGREHPEAVEDDHRGLLIALGQLGVAFEDLKQLEAELLDGGDREDPDPPLVESTACDHLARDRLFGVEVEDDTLGVVREELRGDAEGEIGLACCALTCDAEDLVVGDTALQAPRHEGIEGVGTRVDESRDIRLKPIVGDCRILVAAALDERLQETHGVDLAG